MQPNETTGTACADCGAVFPIPPASGGASGYAITATPLFSHARTRVVGCDGGARGTIPAGAPIPHNERGTLSFPARYDVEHEDEASDVERSEMPYRRICYACSATLERETMTARGRGCLYLTTKEDATGSYVRVPSSHRHDVNSKGYRYRYELSGWPGVPSFPIIGRVKESHGYGFGRRYPVQTFRFVGPDGFVWSGRCAGDMDLARCKRTMERHKGGAR